jgi:hypothetical protein
VREITSSDREPATVAYAAVATEVHQPLDAHRHFAPQIALDRELGHVIAQPVHLGVGQILDFGRSPNAGGGAQPARRAAAYAVDRGKRDLRVLVVRDVNPGDTSHNVLRWLLRATRTLSQHWFKRPCACAPKIRRALAQRF